LRRFGEESSERYEGSCKGMLGVQSEDGNEAAATQREACGVFLSESTKKWEFIA
jgi:hypothetical protein